MTIRPSSARDLNALFAPSSVVVVGASNDGSKYGNWISKHALREPAQRQVYLVNRKGEPVLRHSTYTSVRALPGPVDLAVLAVPARGLEEVVDDVLDAGAKAIVVIASGFAELGVEGRSREAAIVERVRAAGAVLIGPNCLGVQDSSSGLYLSSDPLPSGHVALFSQSGSIAAELGNSLGRHGLGFSRFASLGNQADITAADLIRDCIHHDETKLIAVYCEDFRDGRDFVIAAGEAVAAGKPVVLLTVGSSEGSMRGAASHTGAMTSNSDVIDAACRAAGVDRVRSPREMSDLLALLSTFHGAAARRVAVMADSGGHASVASDVAASVGLVVPQLTTDLSIALRSELTPSAGVLNPIDLAGAGERDITSFARVLRLLLDTAELDAVLLTGYFGGYSGYSDDTFGEAEVATAEEMARAALESGKPVAVHTLWPDSEAVKTLERFGVPIFSDVVNACEALALLAANADRPAPTPPVLVTTKEPVSGTNYWETRALLSEAGITFPDARLVTKADEAAKAAAEIGYPVVVKAMGLLHKSDAGGVALALSDEKNVRAAINDMTARLGPPAFCVEQMVDGSEGHELVVGVRRDPRFGPVVMVGFGGIFSEILHDVAFALAPVDRSHVRSLLESLRGSALLHGVRGRRPLDLDELVDAVVTVARVAVEHPEIDEIEVNPVLVTPERALGLDARIVMHS
ncbi:acetate--CoA ligase family protein [Dactylosporangium sp. NPDC048998]|uniref:acetate--CoA ligase family protein n=1 Tax=Dactylosporangium sp. NPDC048998 TaxID=3363976 RepID=UPI00371BF88D